MIGMARSHHRLQTSRQFSKSGEEELLWAHPRMSKETSSGNLSMVGDIARVRVASMNVRQAVDKVSALTLQDPWDV